MKKKKAEKPDAATEVYLSHGDHVALLIADKQAAIAFAEAEKDAARRDYQAAHARLEASAMDIKLQETRASVRAACEARAKLAADIAKRYAISWEDVALEPLTGQLIAVPKD